MNTLDPADGGPAHNAFQLGEELRRAEVNLRTLVWSGARSDSLAPEPNHTEIVFRDRTNPLSWSIQTFRFTRAADVVILHGFYLPSTLLTALIAICTATPYILMPHGVFTPYQVQFSRRRKALFRLLGGNLVLRRTASLAVASATEADQCARFGRPVTVVGIGVTRPHRQLPKNAPRPGRPIIILTLSRLARKKRVDLTIEAAAHLARSGTKVQLVIAGTGSEPLVSELKAQADVHRSILDVVWTGPVTGPEKERAFQDAHVFVLPSDDENFGITIPEALIRGVPVVTSTAAAAGAILDLGATGGIRLERPTPTTIAAAVSDLCTSPATWAKHSTGARTLAETYASWAATTSQWIALLQKATRNEPGTRRQGDPND